MTTVDTAKNRDRDAVSFANINLLGKCNVGCFFCLGRDIEQELAGQNQVCQHFMRWKGLPDFEGTCVRQGIKKLYVTGQNTDSLIYPYLGELVDWLHDGGFQVGLRTNGYLAHRKLDIINRCELSTGLSIHSLDPATNKLIMGREDIPDWDTLIPQIERPRVSIVLNRYNAGEFYALLKYLARFPNIRYIQVRRVSTDRRLEFLRPDIEVYERVYCEVSRIFGPPERRFVADAEAYRIFGKEVVFWRTTKTSVNSINYFTDGTISQSYFIVEGYLRARGLQ